MAVTALAVAATLGVPARVQAHAEYERSEPASGAVVSAAPERLDVWFTQELFRREGANVLAVTNAEGERVDDGALNLDDADRRHASVGLLPDLAPGEYRVEWQTLSAIDGDEATGTFVFTVDPTAPSPTPPPAEATATPAEATPPPAASPAATVAPSPPATPEGGAFPWWALVAAAAVLGSGAVGAWALRRPLEGA